MFLAFSELLRSVSISLINSSKVSLGGVATVSRVCLEVLALSLEWATRLAVLLSFQVLLIALKQDLVVFFIARVDEFSFQVFTVRGVKSWPFIVQQAFKIGIT